MKSDEMKAVVLTSPYQFKVQHVSIKSMKKEEDSVMLKVSACTLCGSDVKIIKGQMCDVELPLILGHEWTAEVVQAPQTYQHFGWQKDCSRYSAIVWRLLLLSET